MSGLTISAAQLALTVVQAQDLYREIERLTKALRSIATETSGWHATMIIKLAERELELAQRRKRRRREQHQRDRAEQFAEGSR